jgi:hypothetical protein
MPGTHEILPLAVEYGCELIALALDEGGIPKTAGNRLDVIRRMVETMGLSNISLGLPKNTPAWPAYLPPGCRLTGAFRPRRRMLSISTPTENAMAKYM